MLMLLMMGALAVEGAGLVKARLSEASVLSGAGREPIGAMPPPRLSARLEITGLSRKARPRFKIWSLNARSIPALEAGTRPTAPKVGATALTGTLTPVDGAYQLRGEWKGPVEPGSSLAVEVFLGRRRVALATTTVEEHLLPAAKPSGGKRKISHR